MTWQHTPVLLDEVLGALAIRLDGRYLDATFGRGGHTAAILERVGKEGRVISIDRDPEAIRAGRERFGKEPRLTLVNSPFSQLLSIVQDLGVAGHLDGILFDLGVSSPQLDDAERGFSFSQDGPLDMRMDNSGGMSAADWLARAPQIEIARVIREYGEERFANRVANAIVAFRQHTRIVRTAQLADIVAGAVRTREPGKHPATRTFQAIRIHVNRELDEIQRALDATLVGLRPAGRLAVISFHSLEDSLVKRFIQKHSQEDPMYAGLPDVPAHARPKLRRIGKAIHASEAEIERNPRARSAILRVAERLDVRLAA